ncbi:MAG TPA: tRNA (adenosine(37)-N6)-dimethylallyltransferase MiaA [Thermoanaerobaculaceae bacterium]|nr:tRNA (adenosine(37)-N6)-dimethylallyltransferase MiaA [Thermoanaerobaculaceae bacterium]HRS15013.1 tRNA (adenosine(37)-N6)-dimethylallyltransferase MiaA [Thermoanaerobaculaceae bacterium]
MSELIVVAGPTGAGKTVLGAAVAERLGGEVVSADAFAVYRGLDIGTAKPPRELRERVPHHLLDIADPRRTYSAGAFIRDADAAIAAIAARGRVTVVVGGTHFYVRALLRGLFSEPPKDSALRAELEAEWERDPAAVRARFERVDPEAAARIPPRDRQRTLRALEVWAATGRPMSELWRRERREGFRYRYVMLGVAPPRPQLHARIAVRVDAMLAAGLLDEVRTLLEQGVPRSAQAFKAIGYRECMRVLDGTWSLEQAREEMIVATRRLAKRQLTWLRSEPAVEWLAGFGEAGVDEVMAGLEARRGAIAGS